MNLWSLSAWTPAFLSLAAVATAAWALLPRLMRSIAERLVQHKLEERLEGLRAEIRKEEERLRAELRKQEAQITALREGALSTLTQRSARLDARKLAAVEALWAGVVNLGPAKSVTAMAGPLKLSVMADESQGSSTRARNMQSLASVLLGPLGEGGYKHDNTPDLHRPFLSSQVWSVFTAYRQLLARPIVLLMATKFGQGSAILREPTELIALMKAAMPRYGEYLDKFGESGLHQLVQPLEDRLLELVVAELDGSVSDLMTVQQAAAIIEKAAAVEVASQKQSTPEVPSILKATSG